MKDMRWGYGHYLGLEACCWVSSGHRARGRAFTLVRLCMYVIIGDGTHFRDFCPRLHTYSYPLSLSNRQSTSLSPHSRISSKSAFEDGPTGLISQNPSQSGRFVLTAASKSTILSTCVLSISIVLRVTLDQHL